jgi:outer membrane murein-binding lipoprotein Lpp
MTKLVKIMLIVAGVLLLAGTVAGIWIGVEAHSKADDIATDVGTLRTDVGTLRTDVGTLRTDVGTKAEASAVAAALASKADKTAVDAALLLKADKTAVDAALLLKADKTAVDTLVTDMATALASKADKTAVDALKVTVDKKASAFAVRSLTKRVKALECDLVDGTEGCVAAASSSSTVEVRVK